MRRRRSVALLQGDALSAGAAAGFGQPASAGSRRGIRDHGRNVQPGAGQTPGHRHGIAHRCTDGAVVAQQRPPGREFLQHREMVFHGAGDQKRHGRQPLRQSGQPQGILPGGHGLALETLAQVQVTELIQPVRDISRPGGGKCRRPGAGADDEYGLWRHVVVTGFP